MTPNQPRVGIVLINFNSYDDVALCIHSLQQITYPDYEIIVVDNGSKDGSLLRLQSEYPTGVTWISAGANLGYTGGNNLGIEHALSGGATYTLILNNDTIVTQGFLEPLVARLESNENIAGVTGKIYFWPKTVGGRDKVIWWAGSFQKWHTGYHHVGWEEVDTGLYDEPREMPYANGCALLMRGSLVQKLGRLSDDFFIYWEESDWCARMREAGYTCYYEPASVIYHNFSSAILGHETPFYMYMQTRNSFLFAKRHFRGLTKLRYWVFYPIYLLYRFAFQLKAGNRRAAMAMLWGIRDYFRGYRGSMGFAERGFSK